MTELHWLPTIADWRQRLRLLPADPPAAWDNAVALANARLNFVLTNALDDTIRRILPTGPATLPTQKVRLAVLGSATLTHLLPAIRIAGLRRGIWIDIFEHDYGQYLQELADPASPLHAFKPTAILVALDAYHLTAGLTAGMDEPAAAAALTETQDHIREVWRLARDAFRCPILQQTALPLHLPVLGNNEHRLPGSRAGFITRLNAALRSMAEAEGVDLLAIDDRAVRDGIARWHDPALWHRSKQEISPTAGPLYGDLVGRWLAAKQGRSFKCLVLDLDNTLWGGVIGDDGLEGIALGQGSPLGEAYTAFQHYARELSRRGVILAVCSKNDAANALEPFEKHPDMVLRRGDIASFVANWSNKADNIRAIAEELNIGLDALVFIDDNPFERDLVRRELPMVAVPEVADDPTGYPLALADAGYFEALAVTDEDRERTARYQGNKARDALRAAVTDLPSYLRGLEMQLVWKRFDRIGLQRIVQLINKSNQFNLTTRRYTDEDVIAVMADRQAFGLQLRLLDRFGDNGIIAIIIGRLLENPGVAPEARGAIAPEARGAIAPEARGAIAPEARGAIAPEARGAIAPEARGAIAPEARGAIAPEARGAIAPEARGAAIAPEARGAIAPEARGAIGPEARGAIGPEARGAIGPEARGAVGPEARGAATGPDLTVDTWLMSCRVLGRQVEPTTLNLIAAEAAKLGARRLVGEYIPTKKNAMVRDHYARLGFTVMATDAAGGSRAILDLAAFTPAETFIHVVEG